MSALPGLLLSANFLPQTVLAQNVAAPPAASPSLVEEVVVTALKQNETVLETPASVTVLTEEDFVSRNITNANQLSGIVPGLVMTPAVGGLPGTTFRGLGSNSSVFGMESSVAAYVDGVYLGHTRDFVMPLYDIDHMEFIRGTQAALLGKNTSLGAISIVNQRPSSELDYEMNLTRSSEIDAWRAEGAFNAPLADNAQARLALFASDEDGFYDNNFTGGSEQQLRDLSGRLSLAYQPTSSLDMTLTYQHDDRESTGQNIEILKDPSSTLRNRAAAFGQTDLNVVPDGTLSAGSAPLAGTVAGLGAFDNQTGNRLNLIANLDYAGHTLTAQTAYVRWVANRLMDFDFTAANLYNLGDREANRVFSQELRLTSPSGGPIEYVAGLYFYKNTWELDRSFRGSPSNTAGFPLTGASSGSFNLETRAAAAFASVTVPITDTVRLNGGLRYTDEKKEADFVRTSTGTLAGAFPDIPFIVYAPQTTQPLDFNAGIEFEPISTLLLYASYARGSKSGGFQEYPTTPAGAPYSPEKALSAELGAKWRFGDDGSLTFALFDTRVEDFQTNYTAIVGTPAVSQTVVGNSNIRSRGAEASAAAGLMDNLRVTASVTYADAEFTENFPLTGTPVAFDGDPLTRSPEWSGQVTGEYHQPLFGATELFAGVTFDFASSFLHQFVTARPDAPRADSRQLVDARIGLRGEDGRWAVTLLGTNLTDEQYITFATPVSAGGAGIGNQAFYGSINRPRMLALQVAIYR